MIRDKDFELPGVPAGFAPDIKGAPGAHATPTPAPQAEPTTEPGTPTATANPKTAPASDEDPVAGLDSQIRTVEDWLEANKGESDADKARREKRERSRRIIAAVSDGLQALGNVVFTSRYAPDMYDPAKGSQTAAVGGAIDRARDARDKLGDKRVSFALKLGDLKQKRADALRAAAEAKAREQRAAAEEEHKNKLRPLEIEFKGNQGRREGFLADKAGHDAERARTAADYEPLSQDEKLRSQKALTEQRRAAAARSYASAAAAGAKTDTHHYRGRVYKGKTKDYEKDVRDDAIAYNARHKGEFGFEPIVTEDLVDSMWGSKRVPRKPEEYAGEVERRLAEEEESKKAASGTSPSWSPTPGQFNQSGTPEPFHAAGGKSGKKSPTGGRKSPTA